MRQREGTSQMAGQIETLKKTLPEEAKPVLEQLTQTASRVNLGGRISLCERATSYDAIPIWLHSVAA
jgi:hypothetical protein